jgi:hypothetical protein
MLRLYAVHMHFSSAIRIQKCKGFKKSALLRCLDDLQSCSSKVFFTGNLDPDPKLSLQSDPEKKSFFGSTTLVSAE